MSTFQIQHALKLRRPTDAPQATEIEGTCIKGGGKLRHYNQDLFVDLMQSCDWSPNYNYNNALVMNNNQPTTTTSTTTSGGPTSTNADNTTSSSKSVTSTVPRAPRMIKKPAGCHGNAVVVGYTELEEEFSKREREAFEDKQRMRENAFKSKLEATKEDIARRQRERDAARERDFAQRLLAFQSRSREIIAESGKLLNEADALKEKKRERLFREWTSKVFEPEQRQIEEMLAAQDARVVTAKRKELFDKFLAATNAKKSGLFRDIIIESQYDPLGDAKNSSIRYKKVPLRDDPTLTRPQREDVDPVILEVRRKAHGDDTIGGGDSTSSSLLASSNNHNHTRSRRSSKGRSGVSVLQWANIADTTYGRYSAAAGSGDQGSTSRKNRNKPTDNLRIDHYDYPTAQEAVDQLRREGYNYRHAVVNRSSNGGFKDDGVPVAGAKSNKKVMNRLDAMNSGSPVMGCNEAKSLPPIV